MASRPTWTFTTSSAAIASSAKNIWTQLGEGEFDARLFKLGGQIARIYGFRKRSCSAGPDTPPAGS